MVSKKVGWGTWSMCTQGCIMFYYGVGAGGVTGGLNKCFVCVDKRNFCLFPELLLLFPSPPPPPSSSHSVLLNKP